MKSDPKVILKSASDTTRRAPGADSTTTNVPLEREYVRSNEIHNLAVEKYHKNGKGITFNDLLLSGISKTKIQAQLKLKNCLKNQVLFTLQDHKPQQYYPTSIKAHILERKNVPLDPTRGMLSVLLSSLQQLFHCRYTPITPCCSIIHSQSAFQAQCISPMLYPA